MSFYKMCKNPEDARTPCYVFSVLSKDDKDLIALKANMKNYNKSVRAKIRSMAEEMGTERALGMLNLIPLQRISLMARGARTAAALKDGEHPRSYDQSLPHKHAEYFDVYRGHDSHAMYKFRDQIENNITPGQQAAIARIENAIMKFTWDQEAKLRSMGLQKVYFTNSYGRQSYRWEVKNGL